MANVTAHSGLIRIPDEMTYLLPTGFQSDFGNSFASGTTVPGVNASSLFAAAANATFVSFDDAFGAIVGNDVNARQVADFPGSGFFEEAGVWVPSNDEVWFTSSFKNYPKPGTITAYNLITGQTRVISNNSYGAGAFLHNGAVYVGGLSPQPGITKYDTATLMSETVLNSLMGMPFTLADDLVWVTDAASGRSYCFFTVFYTVLFPGVQGPAAPQPLTMPNGLFRWDPQEKVVLPVVGRLDVAIPNGVRVSPDQKTLYVTDSLSTKSGGAALGNQGYATGAAPYIWAFDLNDQMLPVNKRLIGLSRAGYPDGIHIDDAGRIWTAEGDGINVRGPGGKILGLFNAAAFGVDSNGTHQIANFALAKDCLYVAAGDKLFEVKLAEVIATESR